MILVGIINADPKIVKAKCFLNVSAIDTNINYLRDYDKIVTAFREKKDSEELIKIVDAVIQKPKSIKWTMIYDVLSDGEVSADLQEPFSSEVGKSYRKAVKLIQSTPDIGFTPKRIQ